MIFKRQQALLTTPYVIARYGTVFGFFTNNSSCACCRVGMRPSPKSSESRISLTCTNRRGAKSIDFLNCVLLLSEQGHVGEENGMTVELRERGDYQYISSRIKLNPNSELI